MKKESEEKMGDIFRSKFIMFDVYRRKSWMLKMCLKVNKISTGFRMRKHSLFQIYRTKLKWFYFKLEHTFHCAIWRSVLNSRAITSHRFSQPFRKKSCIKRHHFKIRFTIPPSKFQNLYIFMKYWIFNHRHRWASWFHANTRTNVAQKFDKGI